MISVDEARALIAGNIARLPADRVPLREAAGRTLAEAVAARLTQPPFDASAMDGYAVRLADCAVGARLQVIGESAAGKRFSGALAPMTVVRIFTGAPVPPLADHVLIQEEAERDGDIVIVRMAQPVAQNIRRAGQDFRQGELLGRAGERLTGPRLALIAAGNVAEIAVVRRPRVAVIANGDELASPGAALGPDEIVSSIPFGLLPMIDGWGGAGAFLGAARDDSDEIEAIAGQAAGYDLIVPVGGASVGDRDLMRGAFGRLGFEPIFQKVSIKPGKPTWFGRLGESFVVGLPGNPASALVTARLFVKAAIGAMLADAEAEADDAFPARLTSALGANGPRETYLRARLSIGADGVGQAEPLPDQDSSLLSALAACDALIRRPAHAPPCAAGALAPCIRFNP